MGLHPCSTQAQGSAPLPHPHLQIPHRRQDVPLSHLRDHPGGGDGDRPPPGEKGREILVCGGLEADRLEPGLSNGSPACLWLGAAAAPGTLPASPQG
jgi:hypothetical protein